MLAHSGVDVLSQGGKMTLTSPVRRGLGHTECVHFWYHTAGENPGKRTSLHIYVLYAVVTQPKYKTSFVSHLSGSLNVYVKPSDGDRIRLFSSSLGQGNAWHHGQGNVSWHGNWEVGGHYIGDFQQICYLDLLPLFCHGNSM